MVWGAAGRATAAQVTAPPAEVLTAVAVMVARPVVGRAYTSGASVAAVEGVLDWGAAGGWVDVGSVAAVHVRLHKSRCRRCPAVAPLVTEEAGEQVPLRCEEKRGARGWRGHRRRRRRRRNWWRRGG
eukprot:scaffold14186_cov77-Isochrysis_galbana.AAC.1